MRGEYDARIDIHETHFRQTAYHHLRRFARFVDDVYRTEFLKFQTGRILSHDACVGSDVGCRTTGVERTQRQLCTRLTDGLRGNHAHSLTLLNHTAGGKVTSVTFGTHALLGFTGQYERISTLSIGESSIFCAMASVISSPPATSSSPVVG